MQPLQQNVIHYIKMTIEFDDKMPHLDNKQMGRVGGGHWAEGNLVPSVKQSEIWVQD